MSFFFFQAEDGIRDGHVTGVQTCALPIFVIPLSKPIIAVLVLMYAVFQWNSYFDALIYLKSEALYPLQIILRDIIILDTSAGGQMEASEMLKRQELSNLMKYCLIVVASLPVLIIYPFVQRHFVKGVMIGSLKG